MKNRIVIITLILVLSSTFVASNSWAKEDSSFENKIKADSPFYFLLHCKIKLNKIKIAIGHQTVI
ncbi:hypothetical protein [Orenia marismortui]|uniref:hypothetical protein n=1 Tax=Orenia marismortui TaxID=46469 RepID=UPI0003732963|nr:hypothetical protein [Orenia marismortui]